MSGETLEDYFRLLNLDETRRKYLENIKEGKQVDSSGNRESGYLRSIIQIFVGHSVLLLVSRSYK